MSRIQAIRGMHDILPEAIGPWQWVENQIRVLCHSFGYDEIRFPIVEPTELFARTIGENTDIVEKEMYTFADRNGDSLTLRPEGTAPCVRAGIQNGLLHNQTQRLWYMGPMFRHERPQKGRTRQFHQFGVEAFGLPGSDTDVEIIVMAYELFKQLGIEQKLRLELNTLGLPEERAKYREALVAHFEAHPDKLDEESQKRLKTNPLRILDTKNPDLKPLVDSAPNLMDFLGEESIAHFERVCELLKELKIPHRVNKHLVRGLDYYTHTVFEWITDDLGAQGTVCGGGRYNVLVELLGGKATAGVGFALGFERLIELVNQAATTLPVKPHLCVMALDEKATAPCFSIAQRLRNALPGLRVEQILGGGSIKSLFKRADKSGAEFAVIIGEEELAQEMVALKSLRDNLEQSRWPLNDELILFLAQQFELPFKPANME